MQPYQEATEAIRSQGEAPIRALKTAGYLIGTGTAASLGGASAKRALALVSNFLSDDVSKKGLEKIDSRYGKFIKKALSAGKSYEEIKEFIREKAEGKRPSKAALQPKNIIEEHAPELHEYLTEKIGQGVKPMSAAFQAANDSKYRRMVEDLQKKTGKPFSDIVSATFGGQESQSKADLQQPNKSPKGDGDAALALAFQKILNM